MTITGYLGILVAACILAAPATVIAMLFWSYFSDRMQREDVGSCAADGTQHLTPPPQKPTMSEMP